MLPAVDEAGKLAGELFNNDTVECNDSLAVQLLCSTDLTTEIGFRDI